MRPSARLTRRLRIRLALLAALATAGLAGCALIGLGIGAAIDHHKPATKSVPGWELRKLETGSRLVLQLADGRRVEGRFAEVTYRAPHVYAPLYGAAREAKPDGVDLPALGPGARLTLAGKDTPGPPVDLVGLDIQHVVVRSGKDPAQPVPFGRVALLSDAAGVSISGESLQRLVDRRQVPLLSEIRLEQPDQRVALDEVTQVELRLKKGAKAAGVGIGLLVDAIVVIAAITSFNNSFQCKTPDCANSCPFVYSFDGTTYVRDAEVFGGAILEAAQHPDRVRLEHLVEIDGQYRIRLANELPETDHLDALLLLVVDAPPSVRVVAASNGELLTLADARRPVRVRDLRGNDWTLALARTDGTAWLSHPLGREPNRVEDLRDGLLMEFVRPAGANAVTLAFNARSTPWASRLLAEVLALQGSSLAAWRTQMNADAPARMAFLGALRREGLPAISIWDGRAWRPAGTLVDLGPALARDQALRVDIKDVPGERLRVRLDSTPGFWIIDSVAADFSASAPPRVQALEASSAWMNGRDVRDLLARSDRRRLVLQPGEFAELSFAAPPPRHDGSKRAFFVEATGYYEIHLEANGDPQRRLFDRLVSEPGAFSRFSLELFAEDLQRLRRTAGTN